MSVWAAALLVLFGVLLYVSWTDIKSRTIPDKALAAAVLAWSAGAFAKFGPGGILRGLAGAFAVSLPVLLFTVAAEKLAKRELLGGGDIKLIFVTALYLGAPGQLVAIFAACCPALIYAAAKKGAEDIPFGPFLAFGAVFSLFFGDMLLSLIFPSIF